MRCPKTPFATRLSGSAKETRLRIRSIFQWKKKRPPVWLFAFIVAVIFGCIGLVSCQEKEDNLWLGLNARVVEIDTEQMILYIQDIDESAAVFGQRCALDCKQAAEEKKLIFVNYETSDLIDIPFAEFQVGDTLIISMYNSQKEGAKDAAALAVQVQIGTQRPLSNQSVIRSDPAADIVVESGKSYYHVSEEQLTFSITNNRDMPWYYGQDFVIEVLEGDVWYPSGKFLGEVPAVETILNPKHTIIGALNFKDYFETVRPGHYRVVVNPNYGEWASAEFDIWSESEGSIVGHWEAEVGVIGTQAVSPAGEARYILTFMEDLSGKEEIIFDGIWEERSFTYSMTEDEIQIRFDADTIWTFPYHLEDNCLTMTQNHREIVYERVPYEQGEVIADDTEKTAQDVVQQVLLPHCQEGENIGLLITTSSTTKRIGEDIRNCVHDAVGKEDVRYQYQTYVACHCTLCGYDASYVEEPWWSQWQCGVR